MCVGRRGGARGVHRRVQEHPLVPRDGSALGALATDRAARLTGSHDGATRRARRSPSSAQVEERGGDRGDDATSVSATPASAECATRPPRSAACLRVGASAERQATHVPGVARARQPAAAFPSSIPGYVRIATSRGRFPCPLRAVRRRRGSLDLQLHTFCGLFRCRMEPRGAGDAHDPQRDARTRCAICMWRRSAVCRVLLLCIIAVYCCCVSLLERACATSSRMCVRGRCAVMMMNYSCGPPPC